MTHRRIVISDVHGHYNALLQLLDLIAPNQEDQIYFLGDLIDRGPQSAQVVQFVMEHNYQCLLGNHEEMLLSAICNGAINREMLQSWLYCGGHSTLESYKNNIPQEHIDWMKQLPTYLDLGDFWLVHAGIDPKLPIEKQSSAQFCWIRQKFHAMSEPYFPDKLIITGHTITFTFPGVKPGKVVMGRGWLDIETGAYHPQSGWLTALDLEQQQIYQVNTKDQAARSLSLKQAAILIEPSKAVLRTSQSALD